MSGIGGLVHSNSGPNGTSLEHAPSFTQANCIKAVILSVMAVLSFVGNVGAMLSICKKNLNRLGHVYILIFHLCIADLCVTLWCILGEAFWYYTVEWKLGNIACKIFKFSQMWSLYLSTYILVLIGVDRFISVKYPLKSVSRGMCVKFVGACWIISAVLSIPQMVVFHVSEGPFQEPFSQCVTYGFYTEDWQEQLYAIFTLIFMFLFPLIVLICTYLKTVCVLHHNEEFVSYTGSCCTLVDPKRRNLIRRAKIKSLRISVAIVVTFLCCWTPYYVTMITAIFEDTTTHDDLQPAIFFFGMSNSVFNPIIYGLFHLYKPRRKQMIKNCSVTGNSSRGTLLTNLSIQLRISTTLQFNGDSIVSANTDSNVMVEQKNNSRENFGKLNERPNWSKDFQFSQEKEAE